MSRRALAWALATFAFSAPAAATPPRTIVIEAAVGRDDSDAHRYLGDVAAALGAPLVDRPLAGAVDARFGPTPARLSPTELAELAARVRQAERNLFFNGSRVRESIDDLEAARARLGDAQATLAHEHDARALYQHVLLKLARAYQVTPSPEAAQLAQARMQELVRNTPDLPVDAERNERELVQLYEHVRASLTPSGRVTVELPPGAQAFIEGAPVDPTRALFPGDYRLFAVAAHGDGRLHRVTVARGEQALRIDADFEAALRTQAFVGFAYGSPAERAAEESPWVSRLAHALEAGRVFVLTADAADGRPSVGVWGYRVDATGARLVATSTARGTSPADVAQAAARVAAAFDGGEPAPGVTMMAGREPPALALTAAPAPASAGGDDLGFTIAGWSALGVGLPLAVVGAGVWHHGRSDLPAGALVASGLALAGAGTVWTLAAAAPGKPRTRNAAITSALWIAAAAVAAGLAAR